MHGQLFISSIAVETSIMSLLWHRNYACASLQSLCFNQLHGQHLTIHLNGCYVHLHPQLVYFCVGPGYLGPCPVRSNVTMSEAAILQPVQLMIQRWQRCMFQRSLLLSFSQTANYIITLSQCASGGKGSKPESEKGLPANPYMVARHTQLTVSQYHTKFHFI